MYYKNNPKVSGEYTESIMLFFYTYTEPQHKLDSIWQIFDKDMRVKKVFHATVPLRKQGSVSNLDYTRFRSVILVWNFKTMNE